MLDVGCWNCCLSGHYLNIERRCERVEFAFASVVPGALYLMRRRVSTCDRERGPFEPDNNINCAPICVCEARRARYPEARIAHAYDTAQDVNCELFLRCIPRCESRRTNYRRRIVSNNMFIAAIIAIILLYWKYPFNIFCHFYPIFQ